MTDPLLQSFSDEMTLLASLPPIHLRLTRVQAWALLGQLQLALRHPENQGPTADIAAHIARKLQEHVTPTPALAEVARRGWDPSHDQ